MAIPLSELLLPGKSGIDDKNEDGRTALMEACDQCDLDKATALVEHGADVSEMDQRGKTALMFAVQNDGFTELAEKMIEKGANVFGKDRSWVTVMGYACGQRQTANVMMLLKYFEPISTTTESHQEAFCSAIQNGMKDVVHHMIEKGFDPNSVVNTSNGRPLNIACYFKKAEIGVYLINDRNVDVNYKDDTESTPLIWASNRDVTEIIEALLKKGAEVNAQDNKGNTALYYVCSNYGDEKFVIAKMLIDYGADINMQNKEGESALSKYDDEIKQKLQEFVENREPKEPEQQ